MSASVRHRSHIRIGQNVPVPTGGSCPDGRAHRTAPAVGIPPSDVDLSQIPGLITGLGNWSDRSGFVQFPIAHPCHPKTANLDEDPAHGLQQFIFLGGTDQGLVTLVEGLQRPVQLGEFLLRSLALDTLCDPVSPHLEGLEGVLTQGPPREHRQHAK